MTSRVKLTSLPAFTCLHLATSLVSEVAYGRDINEAWTSSRLLLSSPLPAAPQTHYPAVDLFTKIVVRSLKNKDQAKELLNLQNTKGTPALSSARSILTPVSSQASLKEQEREKVFHQVTHKLRLFVQKETKGDFLPDSLRQGIKFNGADSRTASAPFINGRPDLKYGLVLKNIEPSTNSLKMASVDPNLDYQMLAYAPKAKVAYTIGPVYPDESNEHYLVAIPGPTLVETSYYDLLPKLPSLKFRGKIAPSGTPTPGSPIPPQLLTLEQYDGFYLFEARLEKGLSPKSITHKFRLPLIGKTTYKEERNKSFETTKMTLENLAHAGPFALNADHFVTEKRYQLGFAWKQPLRSIEAIAHIPDSALERNFWPQHRWELKADISF